MKISTFALAAALALSSSLAFAQAGGGDADHSGGASAAMAKHSMKKHHRRHHRHGDRARDWSLVRLTLPALAAKARATSRATRRKLGVSSGTVTPSWIAYPRFLVISPTCLRRAFYRHCSLRSLWPNRRRQAT